MGGIDFIDCTIKDTRDRPYLVYETEAAGAGLRDLVQDFKVRNPHGASSDLSGNYKQAEQGKAVVDN